MSKNKFNLYIECGPILCESQFSGIPNVNYYLAKNAIQKYGWDFVEFFHGPKIINKNLIREIFEYRSNKPRFHYESNGSLYTSNLKDHVDTRRMITAGIFTNSRHGLDRSFDFESQIFHDLTTVITPEFHHKDTIEFHALDFERDIKLLDLAICVSESTRKDLISYFNITPNSIVVSHLGGEILNKEEKIMIEYFSKTTVEPYIVMVGTIEPRKNHKIVFEFLKKNQYILDKYKFIIIGRDGWGASYQELFDVIKEISEKRKSRVVHLGFIDDKLKKLLISKAYFSIYASFYEGFGLPVIESLSLGCPVLASFSSSIPEAGGAVCEYFDPDVLDSFEGAFFSLEEKLKLQEKEIKEQGLEWASNFSWSEFSNRIFNFIEDRT